MILENRFAPTVSTKSTLAIVLLALFALPSTGDITSAASTETEATTPR